jgi:RES domain-containing protein
LIIVYRIVDKRLVDEAFSGNGAKEFPGRWNHKGTRVIYASESLSLAALELFVHLRDDGRGKQYVWISAKIPSGIHIESVNKPSLPSNWANDPPNSSTRNIGDAWVQELRSAVLKIPSVVTTGEYNYMLNPTHPDFSKIKINTPVPYLYDSRMWKKK